MPSHAKEVSHTNIAFEQLHKELHLQSRRQDDAFERITKAEADLGRVAKLTAENEGLHAAERQQRHTAMAGLAKRSDEALAACASLQDALSQQGDWQALIRQHEALVQRVDCLDALGVGRQEALLRRQETLAQRVECLEVLGGKREAALTQRVECLEALGEEEPQAACASKVSQLQKEVDALQAEVRERSEQSSHAFRRLDAMEHIFDENTRMRQELVLLRRESERRDLEMAGMQGQIGALTELVREQMSGQLGAHVRCSGA